MQRFSLVWWLRSSLNNSGVIPANPGSKSGVARAGIQEFQRVLDTGFRRYDGEDLNDLFNEVWFQDTSMSSIISPALPRIHATFFDCSNPAHCADITFTMWHGVM